MAQRMMKLTNWVSRFAHRIGSGLAALDRPPAPPAGRKDGGHADGEGDQPGDGREMSMQGSEAATTATRMQKGEERAAGYESAPALMPELGGLMERLCESSHRLEQRQEQMSAYLARLPELAERIPEQQEMLAETLKGVSKQLQQQIHQQTLLAEILEKVSETTAEQRRLMEAVASRVETLSGNEAAVTENLRQLGSTLEGVGRNSEAEAGLLRELQSAMQEREGRTGQIIEKQGTRTTALLAIAIVMSFVATAAVVASTLLLWNRLGQ